MAFGFPRKVLAYVACGRLKSAFQVAAHANNEADVQYVYHEVGLRQTILGLSMDNGG